MVCTFSEFGVQSAIDHFDFVIIISGDFVSEVTYNIFFCFLFFSNTSGVSEEALREFSMMFK